MKLGYACFSTIDQALAIPSCVRINASSLAILLNLMIIRQRSRPNLQCHVATIYRCLHETATL